MGGSFSGREMAVCDVHRVLYTTNESLNGMSETNDVLYIG